MTPPAIDHKVLLKRSLLAIDELKAKLSAFERAASEPIAVVGTGCRLPGGVETPDEFWELLSTGTDAVTEVPRDRWDAEAYFDPNPDAIGKSYSKWGAFLKQVDLFDADFFGVSPREAVSLDPQQRLLLEVTWEALENAGIAPAKMVGSQTGVYLGISTHDYGNRLIEAGQSMFVDAYAVSGTAHSMASGRIAYVFGFRGPNLAMDTACSSSIVATHLAVQALRQGQTDVALAAGANLTITPNGGILTSRGRMASPTGRCHTFDASADGYVRGEGCVVLVLKRLSDAQRDGDRILALIRGSALNQDGRSSGLTAPFGPAQEAVIGAALNNAKLEPNDITYVEAHGTGTSLGDPIEIKALGESYTRNRPAGAPLMVGSVKTNIGHLEGAAGVAGLLKAILALQHKTIPPHLHFNTPNPLIPWDQYPITVPTALTPWTPPNGMPRRAGASSFGFSGTNGHIILEEAPASRRIALDIDRPRHILPLSARTPGALTELAARYAAYFETDEAAPLADIASTAAIGRTHFNERVAVIAASNDEAREKLAAVAEGRVGPGIVRGRAIGSTTPEVVFMCTGQGAQYAGMTRQLYDTQPTFKRVVDRCAELLAPELEQPLLSVLFPENPDDPRINDTTYTQPALFVVEYALAQLWRSWGVEPSIVLGHSVGEYVAACLAGVFTLEDALRLIAARGRLMGALPQNGAMAAIFADESRVRTAIASVADRVSVAGVNGPGNIVISGETAAVETVLEQLAAQGIEFQRLTVSHAFHSPLMDPILDAFESVAASVTFSPPVIPIVSNVTGAIAGDEITTPSYWRRHLREAVRFADSIATIDREGYRVFLEIGPSPTLTGMARRCLSTEGVVWLSSLRKGVEDWTAILETLGALYVYGYPIDWEGFERNYITGRTRVALPTYPFQRQRFWMHFDNDEGIPKRTHLIAPSHTHPLLDGQIAAATPIVETRISLARFPYLADHRIADLVLFPATGYLEFAQAAAREVLGIENDALGNTTSPVVSLSDVVIREALIVPDTGEVTLQAVFTPVQNGATTFQIFSQEAAQAEATSAWRLHASGRAGTTTIGTADATSPVLDQLQHQYPETVDVTEYYERLTALGADYGDTFRGIREIRRGKGQVIGRIQLPESVAANAAQYAIHPALLDACLQLTGAGLNIADDGTGTGDLYVPVGITELVVHASAGGSVWCQVTLSDTSGQKDSATADLTLFNDEGSVVTTIRGLRFNRLTLAALQRLLRKHSSAEWLYEIAWRAIQETKVSTPADTNTASRWILVSDTTGVADSLADALRQQGQTVEIILDDQTEFSDLEEIRGTLISRIQASDLPVAGLVHLTALDTAPRPLSLDVIQPAEQRILSSAYAVAQAAAELALDARLWFITRGSQPVAGTTPDVVQGPIWGLGGVVASEYPTMACTRVDLDPANAITSTAEENSNARDDETTRLAALLLSPDAEQQVAFRNGTRYVARLTHSRLVPPSDDPVRLEIHTRGQLDNLALVPLRRTAPGPDQVEVRVLATGLNFRDVLNTLGMYPGDPGPLGSECAGIVTAVGEHVTDLSVGDEVITMIDQSFATYALAPAVLTVHKPKGMSFAQAATIPVTFLTADYALNHLGRMKAGDRVLIHAAAGGVGMAAIQLARRAGAEIFGTAGSTAKRTLAHSLGAHHLGDSRSLSFADDFEQIAGPKSIDIALNSLAGDFIPRTLDLLAPGGRFIEIGKTDVWDEHRVAREYPGLEYYVLYLGAITEADPQSIRQRLIELLRDFEAGELQPLPHHAFPIEKSVDAFRFMAQAKHTGKIVITQRNPVLISANATYLITGGLGGLGLTVARWMAEEGAQHLVLTSRGEASESAQAMIGEIEALGASVTIARGDVASAEDVERIIGAIEATNFPLRGIIHAAGLVDDAMLPDQTWARIDRVLSSKVAGTWNLHAATGHIPLDFFVMFSSGAAILGSPGQSNYAAANLFLDTLAHARHAQGQPALSINWGSWSDVGMAADISEQHRRRWAALGLNMIAPADGVRAMRDLMLGATTPQAAVLPLTVSKLQNTTPFFSELRPAVSAVGAGAAAASSASSGADETNWHQRISETAPEHREALVTTFLSQQLIRVLALDASYQVDPHRSIMEMGLDSLMAMELRNRIETHLQVTASVADLLLGPTIHQLAATLLTRFVAVGTTVETGSEGIDDAELLENIDTLSEEDLDAQLARLLQETSSHEGSREP